MGIGEQPIVNAKKYILFPQVIDPMFFRERDLDKVAHYKKQYNSDFVCGHIGRIVKSAYPYHLINAENRYLLDENIKYVFYGAKKMDIPKRLNYMGKIPRNDVPEALSAFDITVCGANNWANLSGYLKVLEAAACGVPVIVPRYQARYDEFGRDYPLYWTFGSETHDQIQRGDFDDVTSSNSPAVPPKENWFKRIISERKPSPVIPDFTQFEKESQELAAIIQKTYYDKDFRDSLSETLLNTAQKFSVKNVASIIKSELTSIT
jgi:glycosyltransferase involved in cell wall biosynthesis